MTNLVLAGYGEPLKQVYFSISKDFKVLGVIKDYQRTGKIEEEFSNFLNINEIKKYRLEDLNFLKPNLLFVVNYNKIIDIKYIGNICALNLHIGLLPKYRGNNANACAIMNGERTVGYTIHEIKPQLDAGDVFYQYQYTIKDGETYINAKNAIDTDIINHLSNTLKNIINGDLKRIPQNGQEFIYSCKLKPEDGIILSWNINSMDLINKHIIFSKPLGTGLKFPFNDRTYEINKIKLIPGFATSVGICGAVVMKTNSGAIWVKTADSAVSIEELCHDNKLIVPTEIFKIGDRL